MMNEKEIDEILDRIRLARTDFSQTNISKLSQSDKKATKEALVRDGLMERSALYRVREKVNSHDHLNENEDYWHVELHVIVDMYEQILRDKLNESTRRKNK